MRNRCGCAVLSLVVLVGAAGAQVGSGTDFPRFNFNVGGGFGIGRGNSFFNGGPAGVGPIVGNSFFGVGGAGLNLNRVFGFSGEYMYYDLTPRKSVSMSQDLGHASGALHAASLNGIVRVPYHLGQYGAYGIFGVGFYDRRLSSNTGLIARGAVCQPAWIWWDITCYFNPADQLFHTRVPQMLLDNSKIAGGYNFGGGITYDLGRWHNAKIYGEFRYHKAYQSDLQTIVWPITVGLRW